MKLFNPRLLALVALFFIGVEAHIFSRHVSQDHQQQQQEHRSLFKRMEDKVVKFSTRLFKLGARAGIVHMAHKFVGRGLNDDQDQYPMNGPSTSRNGREGASAIPLNGFGTNNEVTKTELQSESGSQTFRPTGQHSGISRPSNSGSGSVRPSPSPSGITRPSDGSGSLSRSKSPQPSGGINSSSVNDDDSSSSGSRDSASTKPSSIPDPSKSKTPTQKTSSKDPNTSTVSDSVNLNADENSAMSMHLSPLTMMLTLFTVAFVRF